MSDRMVHAVTSTGWEVVRYSRAGKWYLEYKNQRVHVRLASAVSHAAMGGFRVFYGRPGGSRFDSKVITARGGNP